jgi:hypothetical protein
MSVSLLGSAMRACINSAQNWNDYYELIIVRFLQSKLSVADCAID